jgi:hypothetical protein
MTTEHNSPIGEAEAARRAREFKAEVLLDPDAPAGSDKKIVVFTEASFAALIADVRQQAMKEAADICRQLYLHEDIDNGARDCYDAIRARLEEGK